MVLYENIFSPALDRKFWLNLKKKQECIPVGCVPPDQWPYWWGVSAWGYLPRMPARGVYLVGLPGGSTWGVSAQGGVCPGGLPGGSAWWVCLGGVCPGVSAWGCLPRGVSAQGVCAMWPIPSCIWCYLYAAFSPTETNCWLVMWPARHAGIPPPPPPWTEFLTHASENITLPQTSFAGGN